MSRRVIRSRVNNSRDNHDLLINVLIRAGRLPYFTFNALLVLVVIVVGTLRFALRSI